MVRLTRRARRVRESGGGRMQISCLIKREFGVIRLDRRRTLSMRVGWASSNHSSSSKEVIHRLGRSHRNTPGRARATRRGCWRLRRKSSGLQRVSEMVAYGCSRMMRNKWRCRSSDLWSTSLSPLFVLLYGKVDAPSRQADIQFSPLKGPRQVYRVPDCSGVWRWSWRSPPAELVGYLVSQ
jgi:hypothetical protein